MAQHRIREPQRFRVAASRIPVVSPLRMPGLRAVPEDHTPPPGGGAEASSDGLIRRTGAAAGPLSSGVHTCGNVRDHANLNCVAKAGHGGEPESYQSADGPVRGVRAACVLMLILVFLAIGIGGLAWA